MTTTDAVSAHTPGPWDPLGSESTTELDFWDIHGADDPATVVAQRIHTRDVDLISSAPEMLDALRGALDLIEHGVEWLALSVADAKKINAVRAAIAKAEGQS